MKEKKPTYEEFFKLVVEDARKDLATSVNDDQFKKGIEENLDVIKCDYADNCIKFDRGDIDRKKFLTAGVAACSYNLYMLI